MHAIATGEFVTGHVILTCRTLIHALHTTVPSRNIMFCYNNYNVHMHPTKYILLLFLCGLVYSICFYKGNGLTHSASSRVGRTTSIV